MKIGFVGRWSPLDKFAWSGIYFNTYQAIKKYYQVEIYNYTWPWYLREALILQKQLQKLMHKNAAVEFMTAYAKYFGRQLERQLLQNKPDLLFVPSAPQLIAYCKTDIPIIYMTDATFFQLQGYYPLFANLPASNILQGIEMDKRSFQRASHCMVASAWTKQSAVNDYPVNADKITVAPFGANLESPAYLPKPAKRVTNKCRLLFVGVEWERKGGAIALDTFRILKESGVDASLIIVGCTPPIPAVDGVTVIPFINKENRNDERLLQRLYSSSDFLILPTRAECAGIVFCEANSFGLPCITTDTGGVSTYVKNGINGFALPPVATACEYAGKIMELLGNDKLYQQLSVNGRKIYEAENNWASWGKTFFSIAEQIVKR